MTRIRTVQHAGVALAATFALVGMLFLALAGRVLAAFNWLAGGLGWPKSPTEAYTLFLALAVAYMYVVTLLAAQMARHPTVRGYPWVLMQAKAASALICLGLFVIQEQYVIYLANFLVDGAIALFIWWLCLRAPVTEEDRADPVASYDSRAAEGRPEGSPKRVSLDVEDFGVQTTASAGTSVVAAEDGEEVPV